MAPPIRPASPVDTEQVLALLGASMSWPADELHARFFRWKHAENPFGASPAWVAVDPDEPDRIVGFRTFLRWEFDVDGETVGAVRAVDTATHPDFQGQGVFDALTRAAVESLASEGTCLVFNTPNERSLPGYLKMGWSTQGRVPVELRPRGVTAALRMVGGRVAAEKWSLPTGVGERASDVFGDDAAVGRLLDSMQATAGAATRRSGAFLRWRYGFDELRYRAMLPGHDLDDGVLVFRLRRRGRATEAAIVEELAPAGAESAVSALARRLPKLANADYAIRTRRGGSGFLALPRLGPVLTARRLDDRPLPSHWGLVLGDVELF